MVVLYQTFDLVIHRGPIEAHHKKLAQLPLYALSAIPFRYWHQAGYTNLSKSSQAGASETS